MTWVTRAPDRSHYREDSVLQAGRQAFLKDLDKGCEKTENKTSQRQISAQPMQKLSPASQKDEMA